MQLNLNKYFLFLQTLFFSDISVKLLPPLLVYIIATTMMVVLHWLVAVQTRLPLCASCLYSFASAVQDTLQTCSLWFTKIIRMSQAGTVPYYHGTIEPTISHAYHPLHNWHSNSLSQDFEWITTVNFFFTSKIFIAVGCMDCWLIEVF